MLPAQGLIGEGVLHTMRDATTRLLKPGGVLIPSAAKVYAMAVELRAPEVDDFDLSCLAGLTRGVGYSALRLDTVPHVKLSAPAEAFHFDLYAPAPLGTDGKPPDRNVRLRLPVLRRGRCNAIVWWFDLELDGETLLPAGPGAAVRTWKQNVAHMMSPTHGEPGGFDVKRGGIRLSAALLTCRRPSVALARTTLARAASDLARAFCADHP